MYNYRTSSCFFRVNHSHLFSLFLTKISSHFVSYSVNCLSSLFLVFYYFHLCLHGKSEDFLAWMMGENQTQFSLWGRILQSHKRKSKQLNESINKTATPQAISVDLIILPSETTGGQWLPRIQTKPTASASITRLYTKL